jgi:outer membrane immunogenic protein
MSRIKLAIAATAALLVTAPMAQAAPFQFAGFYAGGHFGYMDVDADFDGGGNLSNDGTMGGLQAGYNVVSGNFMWGVETDVSLTSADPDGTCPFNSSLSCKIDVRQMATLRPRIGYAVDNFLIYATGGVAGTRFKLKSRDAGGAQVSKRKTGLFGWTVGAGVEYMIGDMVGVKVEYRYQQFGDFDEFKGPDGNEIDFDMHTVMGGVNFHF